MTTPRPAAPPEVRTEAGKRLLAWADSDARPLSEFGYLGLTDAIADIEAEAADRLITRAGRPAAERELRGVRRVVTHGGLYLAEYQRNELTKHIDERLTALLEGQREDRLRAAAAEVVRHWNGEHIEGRTCGLPDDIAALRAALEPKP